MGRNNRRRGKMTMENENGGERVLGVWEVGEDWSSGGVPHYKNDDNDKRR